MVRIRLQRRGRRKKPFYHIVIADARSPRDGRFIEKIGTYNPMTKPATIDLDRDMAFDWLLKGAQPTDTVRAILRAKGVLYRKHLYRGVLKGALTQEQADTKHAEWIDKKEAGFTARFAETEREREDERRKVAGKRPPAPTPEEPLVDEPVAEAPAAEAPAAEAPAAEAPAAEAPPLKRPPPSPPPRQSILSRWPTRWPTPTRLPRPTRASRKSPRPPRSPPPRPTPRQRPSSRRLSLPWPKTPTGLSTSPSR